ncbi:ARABIDOPSIS NUCLEOBASE-ASCORBATE TRANSPORTER 12, nucleobase-ascorbate transporter 12 [Hibiscus trionum]|uniref:ARABIDOPSIS NUCLEOBASE-ASCORBATE TRANSPORTER 12, nucleobase-ascorbate transporter 12 n=1 Tax=Hibiscus trionum TaxID=183268 RepID=A0A9W7I4Y7_HIBTR|nr:ARABIDOPSIS NUCLEOBASE-ASCORBATE TRANSPORTER 12, nucleobase-ascorbate transporter 12 [Hibiscus trionum]
MSSSDPKPRPKPPSLPPAPDAPPVPPSSWAKRTGFKPKFSGEANASDSGQIALPPRARENNKQPDLEAGRARPAPPAVNGEQQPAEKKRREDDGANKGSSASAANGHTVNNAAAPQPQPQQPTRRPSRNEEVVDVLPPNVDDEGFVGRHSHMKYELRDTPGLVPIGLYGFQHYLSMLGSLILIPLVIVPAMGGTYEDTANVVSTVLFVSGVTTLLHSFFGSRLPLIQGSSFVFLAPALAIINSPEFRGLNGNNFKHIMKELQGAIIIASAFQALLGYSGLMSLFLRLINPVVVAPTIAAVGLSFFSYGFPLVGNCLEIGVMQILLVIIFSLYLRKISVLGHRIFLIYAVPLGLVITWGVALLLTEAGAYSYKGCDANIPASNIISEHCRKHVTRMKHCRVDISHAFKSSPWFRFPYPLQWGTPVFHWKMAIVMCVASIIASVDSVGSYHASSLLVSSRPPTPGVVSRGIGLEGLSSILAGLWGTGTGSTTLTENVHTIAVTKMGSRRAVELGACVLIVLSLVGKVGGFIASIPKVMVAALLCFMWAMLAALAYFQQYGISPNSNLSVPSYFQPYIVTSHGPFRTKYEGVNYVMNTLLSLNMVIAFIVAIILDNTVPGSRQERGVYVWSESEAARREPAVVKDYGLPFRVGRIFRWVKWVGL